MKYRDFNVDIDYTVYTVQEDGQYRLVKSFPCKCAAKAAMQILERDHDMRCIMSVKKNIKEY